MISNNNICVWTGPAILAMLLFATGCAAPPPPDNSNSNGNANTNDNGSGNADPTVAIITLGEAGVFGEGITTSLQNATTVGIAEQVPQEDPTEIRLFIDPSDIALGTAVDVDTTGTGTNSPTLVTVLVILAAPDEPDPCATLNQLLFFDIEIDSTGLATISPESSVVDPIGFPLLREGSFSLCVGAISTSEISFTLKALRVRYVLPGEIVANSCADILALPEVATAVTTLSSNGIAFTLPGGSSVPNLEGAYALEESTTFDPDGDNVGDTQSGTVTLAKQSGSSITREGFGASLDQFIVGDDAAVGFCTLKRTGASTCDQTIARLESHTRNTATGKLEGNFLSVAVRRHAFTNAACGQAGSFVYGAVTLTPAAPALARLRGKVNLNTPFTPDLLILAGDGVDGVVTDRSGSSAQRFANVSPFTTSALALPEATSPLGFSALGMARDSTRVAVVTDQPDAVITYARPTYATVRTTTATTFDYIGGRVDFNLDATRLFVPSTHGSLTDRITVLRTDDSAFADEALRLQTPQGAIPVPARLSPDGQQLVMLLEAGAPVGEAGQLTFGDPEREAFTTPPLDLVADAGGTVLASELLYAPSGERIFLAGLGAVIAVDTQSPFAMTRIDVSNGAGDSPIALALSGDGQVLAVAIDDTKGDADFAVVDVSTLEVLNRQNLPGIGTRRALDVAHFATQRVAIVANLESTVVAVQTQSPFAASDPIIVADISDRNNLGRIESGGDVIAVTNTEEPAVYILEPASP